MNFYLLLPEIAMAILAIVLVVLDLVVSDKSKSRLGYVAVLGLAITAVLVAVVGRTPGQSFFGTVAVDPLSVLFQYVFLLSAALVILSSMDYIRRRTRYQGEFYALIVFATLGAMFLASSTELITLYIALELMSISQFILAGFLKNNAESSEAGMKYLLLGALSSAVLLYGLALLYGATGVTTLTGIREALASGPSQLALMGVGLLIAGFGFKLVVVPFQMYVPDVYQGAPTPVTMFISVASKIAAFSIVLRGLRDWPPAVRSRLARALRDPRGADDDGGQRRRAASDQHQAYDGLLQHRPGGLRADRTRRRQPHHDDRPALLLDRLRRHQPRRVYRDCLLFEPSGKR